MFFQADDGTHGRELWESNGSAAGTFMVKEFNLSADAYPTFLTNVNGTLFFQANDGAHGVELWTSNGTRRRHLHGQRHQPGLRQLLSHRV